MAQRSLRNRTVQQDYAALNSGKNPSKIKDISTNEILQPDIQIINTDLAALEAEEARLEIVIAVAEKQRQIRGLQDKLNRIASYESRSPPSAKKQPQSEQSSVPAQKVTLKDLSQNKDLSDVLAYLKGGHLDFLDPREESDPGSQKEAQGKYTSVTMYSIPDFINKPAATPNTSADKVKKVEDVTVPQWVSANAKIMQRLISEGMEMDGVQQYLRYTTKMGDYMQMSEVASVMLLDQEHRRQVHEEGRQWDSIDSDKVYFHLKSETSKPAHKMRQPTDDKGKPICIRYNKGTCYLTFCKYAHVCQICKGDHPKIHHHGSSVNFGEQQHPPPLPPSAQGMHPQQQRFRHF